LGFGIAVDAGGNAYVTGETLSANFPTQNPLQASNSGNYDAFVTKLNSAGSGLIYSTYLGGYSGDYGNGIAVDTAGNAFVTGYTEGAGFPTQNPLQATFAGWYDAFVTKLNSAGSGLIYSTYLGGSYSDQGYGIAVDAGGNAYVTGFTYSATFFTQTPFQASLDGPSDAFVTKLNSAGNELIYSTYLGGSGDELDTRIAVDAGRNAYVSGWTNSTNFPTQNQFQTSLGGTIDAFVAKLSSAGSGLIFSTYLGGSGGEGGYGIAVDAGGNAYVMGLTNSADFPTQNPFQASFDGGSSDAFVTKLSFTGCCVGRVGDANGEGEYPDEVTLGDIMLLVDAKFISGDCSKLPCIAEADVNQDGGANPTCGNHVTLGDIMTLVDFLFITGPDVAVLPECL